VERLNQSAFRIADALAGIKFGPKAMQTTMSNDN